MTNLPFWNPIVCIVAFVILIAIICLFRSRGQKKYKEGTAQTDIFLSGEEPPAAEQRHIKSHNIYWGFFQTLKRYYGPTVRAHTGIINDYIIWLIALAALTAVILLIASLT
ncbi:MAG: hydrogenase [Dehalococcoidia bacterium]|nr:hydrogenase [Dehalococcoidia bacterium]